MTRQAQLRRIPKIDQLLELPAVRAIDAPRWAVREAARREVEALRRAILDAPEASADGADGADADGADADGEASAPEQTGRLAVDPAAIARRARELVRPALRRVVNATGVVLHTNLGRAPLSARALAHIAELGAGYSNLEYDLARGRRGSRHGHLAGLIAQLTGAEDAVVVNNNASAVMLCLSALAHGAEVIVSRGELVEIGGSFRVPDVMRLSGARLVEVGTTNKTRAGDYAGAITADTAVLLKVHQSNFAIIGFTEEAAPAELAALARARGLLSMMDLGSGVMLPPAALTAIGLPAEPSAAAVVASGVDVVTFSGDKLLGGPQAGIIAGRAEAVARVRRHPLMRALRPDKLTMIALEATLAGYRDAPPDGSVGTGGSGGGHEIPAIAMLSESRTSIAARAATLAARIGVVPAVVVSPCECASTVGGGAMPTAELPSAGLALAPAPAKGGGNSAAGSDASRAITAGDIADALRGADTPVLARIERDVVILDLRCVRDSRDQDDLVTAVATLPSRLP